MSRSLKFRVALVLVLAGTVAAAVRFYGCSMSLEVESEMHHHEAESFPLFEPTPTPAPLR